MLRPAWWVASPELERLDIAVGYGATTICELVLKRRMYMCPMRAHAVHVMPTPTRTLACACATGGAPESGPNSDRTHLDVAVPITVRMRMATARMWAAVRVKACDTTKEVPAGAMPIAMELYYHISYIC